MSRWITYFQKYYTRYYPSRKRLYEKIDARVPDPDERRRIRHELENLIVEDLVVADWVRNLFVRGKSQMFIKSHLAKKGFEKPCIDQAVSNCEYVDDFPTLRATLDGKVAHWIRQGKSRRQIQQKLFEYRQYQDRMEAYLQEVYPAEVETQTAEKMLKSFQGRGLSKEKIVQKLLNRGFTITQILKLVDDK